MAELSAEHKAIIDLMSRGEYNQGKAYRVYYPNMTLKSAQEEASRLMQRPEAQAYHREKLGEVAKELEGAPLKARLEQLRRLPMDVKNAKVKELGPLHNMIKDLLGEAQKLELTGPAGGPIQVQTLPDDELEKLKVQMDELKKKLG